MEWISRQGWMRKVVCWGFLALLPGLAAVPSSGAAELLVRRELPNSLVVEMLQATISKCRADGWMVSAAIVNASGVLQGLLRMDGAGPHTVGASMRKAFGAASFKRSTEILQKMTKPPEGRAWGLQFVKGALFSRGGLPLVVNKEVVGGIGVGGAPGGHLDEACSRAGIEVMKKVLAR